MCSSLLIAVLREKSRRKGLLSSSLLDKKREVFIFCWYFEEIRI